MIRVVLCGSMDFYDEMIKIKKDLEDNENVLAIAPVKNVKYDGTVEEIRQMSLLHISLIYNSDIVYVLNYKKKEIEGYVGIKTFIEMYMGWLYKKEIVLMNEIGGIFRNSDEIKQINPKIMNIDALKEYLRGV